MKWVRISTTISGDPKVAKIAEACGIRVAEAVGLVVCTLGFLPEHARDGNVADVPDTTLEQWAHWHGRRGRFAAAFRANLCDANGIVEAWEKYNGAAIRQADAALERKRAQRQRENVTRDVTHPVTQDKMGYGTGRDELLTTQQHGHVGKFTDKAEQDAYLGYRRGHPKPDAFDHQVRRLAEGGLGPAFGWEVVGRALASMAGNGATWNESLARGYCRRETTPPPDKPATIPWMAPPLTTEDVA